MKNSSTRLRNLIVALFLPIGISAFGQGIEEIIQNKIKGIDAEVGVAIIRNSKDTILINNSKHYPMLSTYKVHQALKVTDYLRKNNIPLSKEIVLKASQLKKNTYSPLQKRYPDEVTLSEGELLRYSLQMSDNNACDILFSQVGGPKNVNSYLKLIGLNNCNIDCTEDEMRNDMGRVYANWSTPLEGAKIMEIIFKGEILPKDEYTSFVKELLCDCKTGEKRIPYFLPKEGVKIAHKTGSGPKNDKGVVIGVNDMGYIELPDGNHFSIAVFIKDSHLDFEKNELLIAQISKIVYDNLFKPQC